MSKVSIALLVLLIAGLASAELIDELLAVFTELGQENKDIVDPNSPTSLNDHPFAKALELWSRLSSVMSSVFTSLFSIFSGDNDEDIPILWDQEECLPQGATCQVTSHCCNWLYCSFEGGGVEGTGKCVPKRTEL